MKKLISGTILSPEELQKVEQSVQSKDFRDFIKYVNNYRRRKYEHSVRP